MTMRIGVNDQGGDEGSFACAGLSKYPSIPVVIGIGGQAAVINGIPQGCCTLYLIGHRGGENHEGGIITYPGPRTGLPEDKSIPILPDENLERRLNHKFFVENCCKDCVINMITCGGDNLGLGHQNRQEIADTTGCTVCGTVLKHDTVDNPILAPGYPGNYWVYSCNKPRFGPFRGDGTY